jgi:hypothetical protein
VHESVKNFVLTAAELSELRGSVRCNRGGFDRHCLAALRLLLKARAAKNWSALCWFEGDCSLHTAGGAGCAGFRPHATAARAFRLALLAVLGVVFELFVVKEKLLACGEHKFSAAVTALQNPIDEFHGRLPQRTQGRSSAMNMRARRSRFPVFESP